MKTLEEVIKAWSICFSDNSRSDCTGCPYADDDGEGACFNHDREDALHHLREYRSEKAMWEADRKGYLGWIEQYKEYREKHQQAVIELKKNPALTWDELRTMEGKPIWVEQHHGDTKGWLLILRKCDDVVTCTTKHGNSFYLYKVNYGEKWQAYRKERS